MQVENDGQRVLRTDYWGSEHARRGLVYLTINAGAIRLLVPPQLVELLAAVREARAARVQIAGAAAVGLVHVLFDDDTDAPYSATLDVRQCDRSLPLGEVGRVVPLFAYTAEPEPNVGNRAVSLVTSIRAVVAPATQQADLSPVAHCE